MRFNVDLRVVMGILISIVLSIYLVITAITFTSWIDKHNTYRNVEQNYFELVEIGENKSQIEAIKKQVQYLKSSATKEKNTMIDDTKILMFTFLIMTIVYLLMIISFSFVRSGDVVEIEVTEKDDDKT